MLNDELSFLIVTLCTALMAGDFANIPGGISYRAIPRRNWVFYTKLRRVLLFKCAATQVCPGNEPRLEKPDNPA